MNGFEQKAAGIAQHTQKATLKRNKKHKTNQEKHNILIEVNINKLMGVPSRIKCGYLLVKIGIDS